MSDEAKHREEICALGASIFARGLTAGSSGNISLRLADGWLMTPTNASLGRLDPARLSVAISCLADIDPADVLPPITAYYVMRVGRLPLVPYFRPGDMALAEAVRGFAGKHHAVLLANHGPVVAGSSLDAAANAIEELAETAKLFLLLRGCKTRFLTAEQVAEVRAAFPS
jgi:ribulose-5-phosphate 4-epimerase/fuculose-1-phosphate aldolase